MLVKEIADIIGNNLRISSLQQDNFLIIVSKIYKRPEILNKRVRSNELKQKKELLIQSGKRRHYQ